MFHTHGNQLVEMYESKIKVVLFIRAKEYTPLFDENGMNIGYEQKFIEKEVIRSVKCLRCLKCPEYFITYKGSNKKILRIVE